MDGIMCLCASDAGHFKLTCSSLPLAGIVSRLLVESNSTSGTGTIVYWRGRSTRPRLHWRSRRRVDVDLLILFLKVGGPRVVMYLRISRSSLCPLMGLWTFFLEYCLLYGHYTPSQLSPPHSNHVSYLTRLYPSKSPVIIYEIFVVDSDCYPFQPLDGNTVSIMVGNSICWFLHNLSIIWSFHLGGRFLGDTLVLLSIDTKGAAFLCF